MKKYNFKDDFEMIYLRHEYLRKIPDISKIDIKPYKALIDLTSRAMLDKYRLHYERVGFTEDDLISISCMYMIAYLGLYGFEAKPELLDKFKHNYKERYGKPPSLNVIRKAERNKIISFLRQKLYHCATVCQRKSRNIIVGRDVNKVYAETENSVPVSQELLLEDYKKYGYRKVTQQEMKELKELNKQTTSSEIYDKDGFKVVKVEKFNNGLSVRDYKDLLSNNANIYYKTPGQIAQFRQDDIDSNDICEEWGEMTPNEKKQVLKDFIKSSAGKKHLKTELKQARLLLKELA